MAASSCGDRAFFRLGPLSFSCSSSLLLFPKSETREDSDLNPSEAVSYSSCAVSCAEVIHPEVWLRSPVFLLSEPLPDLEFKTDLLVY